MNQQSKRVKYTACMIDEKLVEYDSDKLGSSKLKHKVIY